MLIKSAQHFANKKYVGNNYAIAQILPIANFSEIDLSCHNKWFIIIIIMQTCHMCTRGTSNLTLSDYIHFNDQNTCICYTEEVVNATKGV